MSTQTYIPGVDPARVVSELTDKRCRTKPAKPAEHVRNLESFEAESPVRRSVIVGGSARDFDVWERGNEWWAVAEGPGYRILIEAQNIDASELALVAVKDVEPYIAGRNAWTREQRGET